MNKSRDNLLKIHIDGRMLYSSGIGRCLKEIVKEIIIADKNIEIFLYGKYEDYIRYLKEYSVDDNNIIFRENNAPIYSIKEQMTGSWMNLKDKSSDIFYYPHYNLPYVVHKNSVFTIHDFTQFKFPEYFGKNKVKVAKIILNNAVKKAKRIIVVSKSTLKDFYGYFPEFKEKTEVIYNGVSKKFRILDDKRKKDFLIKNGFGKYILFIGNNKSHKNISGLIKSFVEIKKEFKDFKLIIISKGFNLKEIAVEDKIKQDIFIVDEVSDDELVYYYNCAFMFVLPSFYEGFGLPVIEAMACGCPVITSSVSSLPEVGSNAVLYIDPYNNRSLTEGISKIIIDDDFRCRLIKRGINRAKLFSWKNTANKYTEVFYNQFY
jgi:glycosyltransferase involved in cell wall biosynthesis